MYAGHINFVFITGWLDIVFRGPCKFAAVFVIQKPYNFFWIIHWLAVFILFLLFIPIIM